MVLEYFDRTQDKNWLKEQIEAIETLYKYFTTKEHLDKETGLSRFLKKIKN